MLRHKGQWPALSDRERLVLLAIAHELTQVTGLKVVDSDIISITGLSERDFQETIRRLKSKRLVEIEPPTNTSCSWISFHGEALESTLIPRPKLLEV